MARASRKLIDAIERAASKIECNLTYQWGHMGACNCGHLAQELTSLTKGDIHHYAMQGRGDWSEQVEAFCPTSSMPMDLLISELLAAGLNLEDLVNLERLKDREVLSVIPAPQRHALRHNRPADVALYLRTWASILSSKIKESAPSLIIS